jgi:flagella basal body P-ring formation protein FlgA
LRPFAFAPLALTMALPLFAPALGESAGSARSGAARTDPAAIDAAVETFTGAMAGSPGGALARADPRLRLAPCTAPLAAAWHGTARSMVRVECPDPGGWRVFVALRSGPPTAARHPVARPAAPAAPLIERGDPVTVMIRGRGFTVQQAGEAMEAGALGEWIGIRLPSAARPGAPGGRTEPVRARVVRPGLAVIPVGAQAPAAPALD